MVCPSVNYEFGGSIAVILCDLLGNGHGMAQLKAQIQVATKEVKMKKNISKIIERIEEEHADRISGGARNYKEVDLSKIADQLGLEDAVECFRNINAIVPLKRSLEGMKVRIDGRTFVNYVQFESGVAVPGYVAAKSGLSHKAYEAWDSMILNFS